MAKLFTFAMGAYTFALAVWYSLAHAEVIHEYEVSFFFIWGLTLLWLVVSLALQIADLRRYRPRRK